MDSIKYSKYSKQSKELKQPPNPIVCVEHITDSKVCEQYDYITKIILLGDSGVGKSSILRMFTESKFEINPVSTMGIDFDIAYMKVNDINVADTSIVNDDYQIGKYLTLDRTRSGLRKQIKKPTFKFQVWDCAGQERFHSIVKSYIRGAHIVIYTFDITDAQSFAVLRKWKQSVEDEIGTPHEGKYMCVVAGNKLDIEERRVVNRKEALKFAQDLDTFYYEVSAMDSVGIEKMFGEITKIMYYKMLNGTLQVEHRSIHHTKGGLSIATTVTPLDIKGNKCIPNGCAIS